MNELSLAPIKLGYNVPPGFLDKVMQDCEELIEKAKRVEVRKLSDMCGVPKAYIMSHDKGEKAGDRSYTVRDTATVLLIGGPKDGGKVAVQRHSWRAYKVAELPSNSLDWIASDPAKPYSSATIRTVLYIPLLEKAGVPQAMYDDRLTQEQAVAMLFDGYLRPRVV